MAALFENLLNRLGPAELARRLNITRRTASLLRVTPLSRFPRITANARGLTRRIKTNIMTRQGFSVIEARQHVTQSFEAVTALGFRMENAISTIAQNNFEFRASRQGMSSADWISAFPEEFEAMKAQIRAGVREAGTNIRDMEKYV